MTSAHEKISFLTWNLGANSTSKTDAPRAFERACRYLSNLRLRGEHIVAAVQEGPAADPARDARSVSSIEERKLTEHVRLSRPRKRRAAPKWPEFAPFPALC